MIRRAGVWQGLLRALRQQGGVLPGDLRLIAAVGERGVAMVFRRSQGLPDGVHAALTELIELATARPDALRVLMVEIGAAGPPGSSAANSWW